MDTALKVSQSVYSQCFTTSTSHGVENYFPRLWGTGISDAIFYFHFYSEAQNTQLTQSPFTSTDCLLLVCFRF